MVYIPGTSCLYIDLEGNIYNSNKEKLNYDVKDGKILINMFSEETEVELNWLISASYYRIPSDFLKIYRKLIDFKPISNIMFKIPTGTIMVFKRPIFHCKGFRIIPSFVRYAINIKGEVMDRYTGEMKSIKEDINGYKVVSIMDSCKGKTRDVRQHRLLANAYIHNDDYLERPYINHIDGNKGNNDINNLEWCSHEENNLHALKLGLLSCNISLKTRDVYTGEIKHYDSLAQAAGELNLAYGRVCVYRLITGRLPGYLYNKRYEVKLSDDNTPWYYENKSIDKESIGKRAYYTITVTNKKTKEVKIFHNVRRVSQYYRCYTNDWNMELLKKELETRHPELSIEFTINNMRGPYNIYNIKTRTLWKTTNSLYDMKKLIGIDRNMVRDNLIKGYKYIYNNKYIVVPEYFKEVDFDNYIPRPIPSKRVSITHIETGDTKVFESIRQMCIFFGIKKGTGLKIYKAAKEYNKEYKGYSIRPL